MRRNKIYLTGTGRNILENNVFGTVAPYSRTELFGSATMQAEEERDKAQKALFIRERRKRTREKQIRRALSQSLPKGFWDKVASYLGQGLKLKDAKETAFADFGITEIK